MAAVNRDEGRQLGKRQVVKDGTIEYKRERERESGGEVGREGSGGEGGREGEREREREKGAGGGGGSWRERG